MGGGGWVLAPDSRLGAPHLLLVSVLDGGDSKRKLWEGFERRISAELWRKKPKRLCLEAAASRRKAVLPQLVLGTNRGSLNWVSAQTGVPSVGSRRKPVFPQLVLGAKSGLDQLFLRANHVPSEVLLRRNVFLSEQIMSTSNTIPIRGIIPIKPNS